MSQILEICDEYKAFQGYVDRNWLELGNNLPNEKTTRKNLEEECFAHWQSMEKSEKIQYLRFADALKKAMTSSIANNKSQDEKSAKRSVSRARKDGETKAKKKRAKDPNAPKRSMPAYLHFNVATYQQAKEKVGGSWTQAGSWIKDKWATLAPEERQFYENLAQKDRLRYSKELQEYKETGHYTPLDLNGNPKVTLLHAGKDLVSPNLSPIGERLTEFSFYENDSTHILEDHPGPSNRGKFYNTDDDMVPETDSEPEFKPNFSRLSALLEE